MNIDAFWNRVKLLIKQKNVTQGELAKICGFPHSTFRGWMSKGIGPPLHSAYYISRFFGVSLEYLIGGQRAIRKDAIEETLALLNKTTEKVKEIRHG